MRELRALYVQFYAYAPHFRGESGPRLEFHCNKNPSQLKTRRRWESNPSEWIAEGGRLHTRQVFCPYIRNRKIVVVDGEGQGNEKGGGKLPEKWGKDKRLRKLT